MINTNKKIASSFGNTFWSAFLVFVKNKTVEVALKATLGSALKVAGFKAWIIKFLAENLADEIIIPILNAGLVEGKFIVHTIQGKQFIHALKKAENVQDHNDAVDDILS